MNRKTSSFSEDKTERQRRKNLSDEQVEDLELAGGVEGGMPAGSAGGPGATETDADSSGRSGPGERRSGR